MEGKVKGNRAPETVQRVAVAVSEAMVRRRKKAIKAMLERRKKNGQMG